MQNQPSSSYPRTPEDDDLFSSSSVRFTPPPSMSMPRGLEDIWIGSRRFSSDHPAQPAENRRSDTLGGSMSAYDGSSGGNNNNNNNNNNYRGGGNNNNHYSSSSNHNSDNSLRDALVLQMQRQIDALTNKVEDGLAIARLGNQVVALQAEMKVQAAQLEHALSVREQVVHLQNQVVALQAQVAPVQARVAAAEAHARLAALEAQVAQVGPLQEKLSALEAQAGPVQEKLSALEAQVSPIQSQLSTLEAQVSPLQTLLSALESQLPPIHEKLSTLDATIPELWSEISLVECKKVIPVERQVSDLVAQLSALPRLQIDAGEWSTPWDWRTPEVRGSQRINFSKPFAAAPHVAVSTNTLDIGNNKNFRARVHATDVDALGFTVHATTWAGTTMYKVGVTWIAVGSPP
ncbi:Fibrinogen- and Ig-binding protein [Escovopsis weberi]|uniref:Fibrinogen-and Ig-binding protein n=1 Tax=Escovopsis weberi TaxID=150374 RepID=A0A0M8N4K3_ESCWE|nr:Fibrinogen- and Ig-binding protein [Escovopsis weberi]